MKFKLAFVLFAVLALPVMAQDRTPLQGNWLGWGCYEDTHNAVAVSFEVDGDTSTWHEMLDNKKHYVMEISSPNHYEVHNGKIGVISDHKSFHFVLHMSTVDEGSVVGSMDKIDLKFSHGPNSDLHAFYDAYAHFCK
jgi:hypothetical protein